jgi:hypothetical protein
MQIDQKLDHVHGTKVRGKSAARQALPFASINAPRGLFASRLLGSSPRRQRGHTHFLLRSTHLWIADGCAASGVAMIPKVGSCWSIEWFDGRHDKPNLHRRGNSSPGAAAATF